VPWWSWPIGLGLAAFAAAEVFLGAYPSINWIPYVIFISLTIIGLVQLGRIRISVDPADATEPELRVDDAHIPLAYVTGVDVLDRTTKAELMGPAAAPHVFVVQRPWVRDAIRVTIDDPADPTPYWIISSRRASVLADVIEATRTAAAPTARA